MRTRVALSDIEQLLDGRHENPASVLGPRLEQVGHRDLLSVAAFDPTAKRMWLLDQAADGASGPARMIPMRQIHPGGVFESASLNSPLFMPNRGANRTDPDAQSQSVEAARSGAAASRYRLISEDANGQRSARPDPYAFPPILTDYDLHLLNEGTHWEAYLRLGAHLRDCDGVRGVNFAVWAPNAKSVSVVGEFNDWDRRRHAMRKHIPSGFWELFVPGLEAGTLYKFSLRDAHDAIVEKSDPYGFAAEPPPRTASVVTDLGTYAWDDNEWIARRPQRQALDRPLSIYEVHLGSWRREEGNRWLTYRELAEQLVPYVKEHGFTHIELLPVCEHPLSASWGYQTVGYFAPTARHGSPQDFMAFVDHCHQHEIGVLLDWTPAHFPRDAHGLARFDGTCLYEHADPRQGEHREWGTLIFNYGRNEVRNFLIANALFWIDRYHLDGLRVDAVASMLYLDYSREADDWIPNEHGGRENLHAISFLKQFNEQVHVRHPGVLTIAEESTAWPAVSRPPYLGGLGFSLKWNMGWMNDTLGYYAHEPIHRKFHHSQLTFSLIYAFHENFVLPLSHDEVVHGKAALLSKMPGDMWQQFANLRLLLSYMWTHPGKKLLFMGGEFGQWNEWDFDQSLDWHLLQWESHTGMQRMVADLNRLLTTEPALYLHDFDAAGFEWIDCNSSDDSTLTFLRKAGDDDTRPLIVAANYTPVPRLEYAVGVPRAGWYRELFNSDAAAYGGGNLGNGGGSPAEPIPHHGRPATLNITLPPLGLVVFQAEDG